MSAFVKYALPPLAVFLAFCALAFVGLEYGWDGVPQDAPKIGVEADGTLVPLRPDSARSIWIQEVARQRGVPVLRAFMKPEPFGKESAAIKVASGTTSVLLETSTGARVPLRLIPVERGN